MGALWDRVFEARLALYLAPAPSTAALAVKLRLIEKHSDEQLTKFHEIVECLSSDARRFGQLGAHPQTDDSILQTFAGIRQEMAVWFQNGCGTNDDDEAATDRTIRLETTMFGHRAHTVEGIIAHLRVIFQHTAGTNWSDHAVVDPTHPDFIGGLEYQADGNTRALWNSIEDLARIGGVNLAEQGRRA